MALPQNDLVGERYDLGLLPQQQSTLVQLKRRKLELLQALSDKLTGGIVPRTPAGSTPMQAGVRAGLERFTQAATSIPEVLTQGLLNIPNTAYNDIAGIGRMLTGKPEVAPQQGPLIAPEMLDASDVFAGAQRLGEGAAALTTGNFSQFQPDAKNQQQIISESMARENPMATTVGRAVGDVATLATLRSPVARARSMAEISAAERAAQVRAAHQAAIEAGKIKGFRFADSLPDALREATANSTGFGSLMNRTGRAAETGLEGAALAILQDGDPMEMAAYSAGGQAAGSLLLGGLSGMFSGKMGIAGNLAVASIGVGTLVQLAKSAAPGGQDRILESVESGFNKVMLGLATGALAGVAGAGRFPVKSLPVLSDALTSLPRAATLSVLHDALNDTRAEKVINQFQSNPDYFGPSAARRLERAFRNPNISISGVIDDLMKTRAFREKYEALEKAN
jgi:hypothetical protein